MYCISCFPLWSKCPATFKYGQAFKNTPRQVCHIFLSPIYQPIYDYWLYRSTLCFFHSTINPHIHRIYIYFGSCLLHKFTSRAKRTLSRNSSYRWRGISWKKCWSRRGNTSSHMLSCSGSRLSLLKVKRWRERKNDRQRQTDRYVYHWISSTYHPCKQYPHLHPDLHHLPILYFTDLYSIRVYAVSLPIVEVVEGGCDVHSS